MSDDIELEQIFSSIDAKLALGQPETITDQEINRCFTYYSKLKHMFNTDQANFIRPSAKTNKANAISALIESLRLKPLEF